MTVLRRTLHAHRRGLIAWTLALIGLAGITVAAFPSVAGKTSFDRFIQDYPEFVQEILGLGSGLSITKPAGYLNSQFFSNVAPLLFIIFLVSFSVRETAVDERDGTLDLVAAHPIARTRLMIEKALAALAAGTWLAAISMLTLIASAPLAGMDISPAVVAGATVSIFVAAVVFGGLAFGVGAATGSRGIALGASSGIAIAAFILWGLAPLIDAIRPLERLSPFFWAFAGDPILHGIQGGNALGLLGVGVGLAAIGIWRFDRRDIRV